MTLFREFSIEAGRYLPRLPTEHHCAHMHGHTFVIQVYVTGNVDEKIGWIMDLNELDERIQPVRHMLDHKVLNNIAGLENPTTEQLARWIWNNLVYVLPGLSQIIIRENPYSGCINTGE